MFSALADSALFILCVSLISTLAFPAWMTPMLKMGFVLSYILLAPFAGAFADTFPKGRVSVMPLGAVLGLALCAMALVHSVQVALPLLLVIGILAGLFVVPMNAVLQHRGHSLMSAGQSIAVQNFNENLAILAMTGGYAMALQVQRGMNTMLILLGAGITLATLYLRMIARTISGPATES
ncbi:MAG: hypothetical protein EOO79_02740 [Oxalobacteraceae bacterium]|nr:MAG: hypothetical protein EOO79_02740 [Oxalobacteraceae bacterium]